MSSMTMQILALVVLAAAVRLSDAFLQQQHALHAIPSSGRMNIFKPPSRLAAGADTRVIGTRGSPLAQAQAYETKRLLEENFPQLEVDIKEIVTKVIIMKQVPTAH